MLARAALLTLALLAEVSPSRPERGVDRATAEGAVAVRAAHPGERLPREESGKDHMQVFYRTSEHDTATWHGEERQPQQMGPRTRHHSYSPA